MRIAQNRTGDEMERKIGEVFGVDGVKVRVEKNENGLCFSDAGRCPFFESRGKCKKYEGLRGPCTPENRADKTDVIFREVTE